MRGRLIPKRPSKEYVSSSSTVVSRPEAHENLIAVEHEAKSVGSKLVK
jgi:hypothetical protein